MIKNMQELAILRLVNVTKLQIKEMATRGKKKERTNLFMESSTIKSFNFLFAFILR